MSTPLPPRRVAVLGAGPAGLTAALALAERGVEVDVLEAAPHVGGLARSIDLWGWTVDLGAHVFHSDDPRVQELWSDLAGSGARVLPLRRGIHWHGRVLPYPPRPGAVLADLRPLTALRAVAGAASTRLGGHRPARSAEDLMVARYGRVLTEELFEPYCRKLWGLPSSQVDASFAHTLLESAGSSGDRFTYPEGGTGAVWGRMAERIAAAGGRVHLDRPVQGLVTGGGAVRAVDTAAGRLEVDHVVSTLPVGRLVRLLGPAPGDVAAAAAGLTSRSTLLTYLMVLGGEPFEHTWLYCWAPELRSGRIVNFATWAPPPGADRSVAVLAVEQWCDVEDEQWRRADRAITDGVARELEASGLLGGGRVADAHLLRLAGTHPACPLGTAERLATLHGHVATFAGLSTIGRHGTFAVPGVGQAMEGALRLVDELLLPTVEARRA